MTIHIPQWLVWFFIVTLGVNLILTCLTIWLKVQRIRLERKIGKGFLWKS